MHTILKRSLVLSDFEHGPPISYLRYLNKLIKARYFEAVKDGLPEGFLQRRIVCCNYKVLSHIYEQRKNHKLKQWHVYHDSILNEIQFPHFVTLSGIPL